MVDRPHHATARFAEARSWAVVPVDRPELATRFAALPAGPAVLDAVGAGSDDVYLVGGAVRDLWLATAPRDLDLVVAGDVTALAQRLADRLGASGADRTPHARFQTVTLRGRDGVRYDLAAARTERYARPGALPEVQPSGIAEDLARRDFSVNALAFGLSGADRGRLLEVPGGTEDLAQRRLRVLHDDSFRDDPTRLLRLARYAGRLGFAVEPGTERLVRSAVRDGALGTVSGARIGSELALLAGDLEPVAGFEALRALGVDEAIAPGFGVTDPSVARTAVALLARSRSPEASPEALVLAVALLGVARPERRPLLDLLGIDRHTRTTVLRAAADAPALAGRVPVDGPPSRLLDALPVDSPVTIALAGGLADDASAAALVRWFTEYAPTRLAIDGSDLIDAGLSPGPVIASALHAARAAVVDGAATTREEQLAVALRAAAAAG